MLPVMDTHRVGLELANELVLAINTDRKLVAEAKRLALAPPPETATNLSTSIVTQ